MNLCYFCDIYDISQNGLTWENGLSLAADVAGLLFPAVTGGGLLVRAATHLDDAADAARATNRSVSLSDEAIASGRKLIGDVLDRIHHLATNKNSRAGAKWTTVFENFPRNNGYGDLLGLDLKWNKVMIPHANKPHSPHYHEWISSAMERIDAIAEGDSKIFRVVAEICK